MAIQATTQRYKEAAQQLPSDLLARHFENGLGEVEPEPVSKQTNMSVEEERTARIEAYFKDNRILMAGENLDGINFRGAALAIHNLRTAERLARQKKQTSDMIAILLDQAHVDLAAANKALDEAQDKMDTQYGDAWREEVANEILDPDDIPQRKPNESMEDYRDRLEETLMEEMIDPQTGEIKDEYKNHESAKVRDAADAAKIRYDRDQAQENVNTLKDPNATPEEKLEAVKPLGDVENVQEANLVADGLKNEGHLEEKNLVENTKDVGQDEVLAEKRELNHSSVAASPWV